jgi:hypothetical protein
MRYVEREAAADEEAEITIETRREALVLARWFKKNASQLRRAIPERPLFFSCNPVGQGLLALPGAPLGIK